MPVRRNRLNALLLAITCGLPMSATPADACGLTDWLYGRPAVAQQTAFYAPVATSSSTVALPISPTLTPTTATAYRPLLAPQTFATTQPLSVSPSSPLTSALRPAAAPTNFWGLNGPAPTVTAARPVVIDNPSVYTGRPVVNLRGTNALRGVSPATNFGASNIYPTTPFPGTVTAARPVLPGQTSFSVPANALTLPATTLPVAAAPRPTLGGGLRRFFGSLFGTNYRTTVNRVPTTFYRPVTTLNPVTGTPVTTQQACTGVQAFAQRTPIAGVNAFGNLPAGAVPVGSPIPVSGSGVCTTSTIGGFGSVAQAGATMTMPNQGFSSSSLVPTTPPADLASPATAMPNSAGSSMAPLTQSPSGNPGFQSGDDFTPVERPELAPGRQSELRPPSDVNPFAPESIAERRQRLQEELRRLDEEAEMEGSSADEDSSYWTLPRDEDTHAMVRPQRRSRPVSRLDQNETMTRYRSLAASPEPRSAHSSETDRESPSRFSSDLRYRAEPIRGMESESGSQSREHLSRDRYRTLVAPPLAQAIESSDRQPSSRHRARRSVEAREIGLVRYDEVRVPTRRDSSADTAPSRTFPTQPVVQRDATWKPVR